MENKVEIRTSGSVYTMTRNVDVSHVFTRMHFGRSMMLIVSDISVRNEKNCDVFKKIITAHYRGMNNVVIHHTQTINEKSLH